MKIESQDTSIENLLSSSFLMIPRFQRPYSWDDENIEDFWKDVTENDAEDYFIGSMVIYKNGRQQYGVVDGQQRLTTITILLCAIRDRLALLDQNELAKGLHNLIERADRENVSGYVLKTETSYPYFQEEIQKFGDPEIRKKPGNEEIRIEAAYRSFATRVVAGMENASIGSTAEDAVEKKVAYLKKLRDRALFLKLIRIELDNEDDAYVIFETLNTRGKDLALSDLLKNHFAKLIKGKGDVDFFKIRWQEILSGLQASPIPIDADTFFVHSWASRYESTTQQKAFKRIKESINKEKAKDYLNDFSADSKYYRSIFDPNAFWGKEHDEVKASLAALNLFRVSQPTPGVLSLVRSFRDSKIKLSGLKRALSAIEDFHFLFTSVTSSRSSGGVSAMYASFGRKLFEAKDSNESGIQISELIDKLVEKRPSLDEFLAAWMQIGYSTKLSKQSGLVRYILKRISRHQGLAFTDDYDLLTVEHIHPQSDPNLPWTEESVAQIGNLMYLTKAQNGKLTDEGFVAKRKHYLGWPKTVPESVLAYEEWGPSEAATRGRELGEIAYTAIWTVKR